jgi:hypothetical protein
MAINNLTQKFVILTKKDGKVWISIDKRFLPQIKKLIEYTDPVTRFIETSF